MNNNLDDLIVNLKIAKPISIDAFIKMKQPFYQQDEHYLPRFNSNQIPYTNVNQKQPSCQQDSVIIDNYDQFNYYSFYELKQNQPQYNNKKTQEFSFCHPLDEESKINQSTFDDSLSKFSTIVDKLKTQEDCLNLRDSDFFYDFDKNQQTHTERYQSNQQIVYQNQQQYQNTSRRHTQYFSGQNLKSNQKCYKNMAKKTIQKNFSKPKKQPIYAKLTLPFDKQNIHQNSNLSSKNSVISNLSSKKSTYSSAMKKPINISQKIVIKRYVPNTSNKQKIKDLNEKIRKENHIIYQSEFKSKQSDQTPLQSFKKTNIQPHKFSTYKVKLFG